MHIATSDYTISCSASAPNAAVPMVSAGAGVTATMASQSEVPGRTRASTTSRGSNEMVPNPPHGATGGYESCVDEHRGPMERLR